MARRYRFDAFGGPEVLRLEKIDVPSPAADEVRIDVHAIGLNRAECLIRSGTYIETPDLPSGLGFEASGVVESIGAEARSFKVGQSVSLIPPISISRCATYADRLNVPASLLVPTPPGLDAISSAALWMGYLTAYGALIDIGHVKAGDVVAVTAASSSVGVAAIQISRSVGALPIALTRTSRKAKRLLDLGAAEVLALDHGGVAERLGAVAGERGVRLAFDAVGGALLPELVAAASRDGIVIEYGALDPVGVPFPSLDALAKQVTIRGYLVHHVTGDEARLARAKAFISAGLASGDLRPVIDRVFPFERMADAHRHVEAGGQLGKVVVRV